MQRISVIGLMVVAAILVVANGCSLLGKELNEVYCKENFSSLSLEETAECCEAFPRQCESGGVCASDDQCVSFDTPYCLVDKQECVGCLEDANCTVSKPVCDAETHTCVECQSHGQCVESNLCLDTGSCAAQADILYVGGPDASANATCDKATPCENLTQALAVTSPRKYIKVTGAISADALTSFGAGVTADIYGEPGSPGAPGTTLTRSPMGLVLEMRMGAKVKLFDLEIKSSGAGDAIDLRDNAQTAVELTRVKVQAPLGNGVSINDGQLTLRDSEVSGSLVGMNLTKGKLVMKDGSQVKDNAQDGVKATGGTVQMEKSFITGNNGAGVITAMGVSMLTIESSVIAANKGANGGASIAGPFAIRNSVIARNGSGTTPVGGLTLTASSSGTFEFNTVADNISTSTSGFSCGAPVNVVSSILTGTKVFGCNVSYSLADTMLAGEGNITGDPMFLSTDAADPRSPMFYRIGASSRAKDAAGPSQVATDIDGDSRPVMGKDMGADEFVQRP